MAQSSITSTSMRLSRVSNLRRLPSARAMARSRNSAADALANLALDDPQAAAEAERRYRGQDPAEEPVQPTLFGDEA